MSAKASNVVKLSPREGSREAVVESLEDFIRLVRDGKIVAVAVVGAYSNEHRKETSVSTRLLADFVDADDSLSLDTLIAGLERMKLRLLFEDEEVEGE